MFIMYRRHSVSKVYNRKFARKIIFTNRDQDILYFSFIKRIWISQFQQDMISECWIYKTSCEIIFKFCYQYNLSVIIATFFEVHMVHLLRLSFFIWYHLWKKVTIIYISSLSINDNIMIVDDPWNNWLSHNDTGQAIVIFF